MLCSCGTLTGVPSGVCDARHHGAALLTRSVLIYAVRTRSEPATTYYACRRPNGHRGARTRPARRAVWVGRHDRWLHSSRSVRRTRSPLAEWPRWRYGPGTPMSGTARPLTTGSLSSTQTLSVGGGRGGLRSTARSSARPLPRHRCALCEASRRMARGEHCRRDRQQPVTAVGDRARPARTLEPRQLGVTDRRRLDRSLLRALRQTHALLDPRWHTAPSSAEMTASKVRAQAS
jgi:hypothetical protein